MFLINPKVLVWARNTIGMGVDEASRKLGVGIDTLKQWEEGTEETPFRKLNRLSDVYKRSSAVFLMDSVPTDNYPKDFRDHIEGYTEDLQKETLMAFRKARQIQTNFVNLIGQRPNLFIQKITTVNNLTDVKSLVRKVQEILEEDYSYINRFRNEYEQLSYWKDKLSQLDILIVDLGFDRNDARAFLIYDDSAPIICLNTNDSPKARIFSIFHELAHIILKKSSLDNIEDFWDMKSNEEAFCNQLAGDFLVPREQLLAKLEGLDYKSYDLDSLLEVLGKIFVVSSYAILISLYKNQIVDSKQFNTQKLKLTNSYKQFNQARRSAGGNYYSNYIVNNSKKYIQTVFNAYNSNKLSYSETLGYLGVKAESLPNIEYLAFK